MIAKFGIVATGEATGTPALWIAARSTLSARIERNHAVIKG